ncbi:hypothetical protein DFH06DRAFT_535134 [Mycena polygramma]|nr:hypothetical protein DFH06DRAFT_535134 [Mycena polygramma]
MGHRHEDCPTDPCPPSAPRPPKGDFLVCKNCRREGHNAGHCPKPLQCRACGGEGHSQKDCPNPDPARLEALRTPKPPICFRCGEEGHSITECAQPRPCYGCGQPQEDCPTEYLALRARRASQAKAQDESLVVKHPAPLKTQEDHHEDPPENPVAPVDPRPAFLICNNCRREGHNAGNCPKPLLCRACGGEGHRRKDCPNPDPARVALLTAGPGRIPTCFRCGLEGHRITECEQQPVCYGCGQPGHHHNDCPINPPGRPAPRIPRAPRIGTAADPLEPLELDRILAKLNSRPLE